MIRHNLRESKRQPLQLENLEDRVVLTGGFATIVDGELIVCGTDADDTIIVADLEDQFFVHGSFLRDDGSGGSVFFDKSEVTSVTVRGGDGNDTIVATSLRSTSSLEGNNGDDRVFGGGSTDDIQGGMGSDIIFGNGGDDNIDGGLGNDRVFAGNGDDVVNGNFGNDTVYGNEGNDVLVGNEGDDNLFGSAGVDDLDGGAGNDRLVGGNGDDQLSGGIGNDELLGDAGNDELLGGDGVDELFGGANNDTIDGGEGSDRLLGGNGNDRLNGGEGPDMLFGDSGTDVLRGGSSADWLFGGTGPDMLFGGNDTDQLNGGVGNDILLGEAGFDDVFGGTDRDIIFGGADRDTLNGQGGSDLIATGNPVDSSETSLEEIRNIWNSDLSYDQRVDELLVGTLMTDVCSRVDDVVLGGTGRDAFRTCAPAGPVVDQQPNERVVRTTVVVGGVVMDDEFDVAIDEMITASVADNDVLGDLTTFELVRTTNHGELEFNSDGTFIYTQTNYGRDSFEYRIAGFPIGEPQTATVNIITEGLPLLPDDAVLETSDTGLEFFDFTVGSGDMPDATDTVEVGYTAYLPDGTDFDSADPIVFDLPNLIAGFSEGVQGMRLGGFRRLIIPPELGFGADGLPSAGIGGMDTIIFDVRLITIV